MVKLQELVPFLDTYLDKNSIQDDSYNGLQFEGKEDVNKIMFAVDAGIETFEKAVEIGADMIIVHHGLFWEKNNPSLRGVDKERIDILYKNNISLYAMHLPLDRHKEIGNNAGILKMLDAEITGEFVMHEGKNMGWVGTRKEPISIEDVENILATETNAKCHTLAFGPKEIKTIAVCSGGGGYPEFFNYVHTNIDLYITGDASEVYHASKDMKKNVIFAGHHATETVGVKLLSGVVKNKFDVECEFVDIPTGL